VGATGDGDAGGGIATITATTDITGHTMATDITGHTMVTDITGHTMATTGITGHTTLVIIRMRMRTDEFARTTGSMPQQQ
jgi:hypothetical protein